jgi:hypothetical protein
MKQVFSLAAGAAAFALIASPAAAKQDLSKLGCTQVQNDQCTAWNELTPEQARRVRSGDFFGPNYPYYMDVSALPADMVSDYELEGTDRYIGTSNGYLFVVDPHSYKVTRVIAPERSVR